MYICLLIQVDPDEWWACSLSRVWIYKCPELVTSDLRIQFQTLATSSTSSDAWLGVNHAFFETREGSHCVAGWRHERPIHLRLFYLLASLDLWPLPCLPWWFFAAVGAGPGELGQAAASRTAWLKLETHARGWEREHTGRFNGSEGGSVVDREGVWGSGGDVRWGECCWVGERGFGGLAKTEKMGLQKRND